MRSSLIALLVTAALPGAAVASSAAAQDASDWEIGPLIRGKNYSKGMPLHPRPTRTGWSFDFPAPDADAGHVHYVTFRPGSLAGKTRVVVRYRIDARPGTRFVPHETPQLPGAVSVYFQRRGDSWSAKRDYEYYRWFAPANAVRDLAPGEHEISVRFDDPEWISAMAKKSGSAPGRLQAALNDVDRIGLTFGATVSGRGHGVYATAPARFTLLSFDIR